jgi:hypothetical protein
VAASWIRRRWRVVLALTAVAAVAVVAPVFAGKVTTTSLKSKSNGSFLEAQDTATDLPDAFPNVNDSSTQVGDMTLDKGNYLVSAKLDISPSNGGVVIQCILKTGSHQDSAEHFGSSGSAELVLQTAAKLKNGGSAQLFCGDGTAQTNNYSHVRMTAIEVPKLSFVH